MSSNATFSTADNKIRSEGVLFGKPRMRRYSSEFFQPFFGIGRYIKVLFVLYIVVSLLYTLTHFYTLVTTSPQQSLAGFHSASGGSIVRERTVVGKIVLDTSGGQTSNSAAAAAGSAASGELMGAASSDNGLGSQWTGRFSLVASEKSSSLSTIEDPFSEMGDDLLFSKLFQYSLKPSKIIPYYYRALLAPTKLDITITTLITIERLHVFNNLVNKYQGPISVTLHINDDDDKQYALEQLHNVHESNPLFAKYVDVHLVVDNFDRQFNLWRNIARFFARSELIMTTDVDFFLCSDLKSNVAQLSDEYKQKLISGKAVFVVPAFEFSRDAAELDVADYPAIKSDLMGFVKSNEAIMFHNKWKRGHGPTNYDHWYDATEPYKVIDYNYNYEPYVLMKRDGLPWCDERFVGYGSNKAACLYEIFLSGAEFWVLPNDFLIHQRHPYPESDRRVERKYNKRLYDSYREEACFRYSRMSAGVPNSTLVDERICGSNFPNYEGL